jgi:Fanconi anemia group M protein
LKEVTLEICVDSNEAAMAERVVNDLRLSGCLVKTANLPDCDYIVSDRCGIERKEVKDFAISLMNGRLFEQAKRLAEGYEKPLLILQGELLTLSRFTRISPNSLWGALSSLALDFGIAVIPTPDTHSTAQLIHRLAYHEQAKEERPIQVRKKKRKASLSEEQLYFLCGIPNIGRSLAEGLLNQFQTPLQVVEELVNAEVRVSKSGKTKHLLGPIGEVKRVGPSLVEKAKKVLNTCYEEYKVP